MTDWNLSSDGTVLTHTSYGVVMADTEQERKEMNPFLEVAHGKVLVIGLGIGLVVWRMLDECEAVTEISVLEIDPEVVSLVDIPDGVEIIVGDSHTYDPGERRWDCVWVDTWGEFKPERWKQYADNVAWWPYGTW